MLGIVHLISECPPWLTRCVSELREHRPRLGVTKHRSLVEFLERYDASKPSTVVVDLSQLEPTGKECCELLRAHQRAGLGLLLTDREPPAHEVVRALHHGVVDYLNHGAPPTDLLEAIDMALAWSRQVACISSEIETLVCRFGRLTERELEVLDLMALGKTSKEIAQELHINKRTVDYHRERILRRIEARSAVEVLALLARRERFGQQRELLLRGAPRTDDPTIHEAVLA